MREKNEPSKQVRLPLLTSMSLTAGEWHNDNKTGVIRDPWKISQVLRRSHGNFEKLNRYAIELTNILKVGN